MRTEPPLRVHALISSLTWGGAEMLLAHLAEGAPAAGLELSVGYLNDVDGAPAAEPLRRRGIEPTLVPIDSLLGPSDLRRVRRHLATGDWDVLHTHLGYADLMGGVAARSLGRPAVASIHVAEQPAGLRDRVKARLMALARRRCAARVIAPSESARRWYLSTGWDRPERVVTVHNGVAAEAPAPGTGPAVRAELGLGPGDLVAAIVTVLRAGKGHDVAIAAVAELRERFPGLRLLVLGEGPARAEVERLAAPLGDAAILTGHRDDVVRVLAAVDVLVHPSSADAFPTALLEAMAAGVPVVATAVGGIPEIVEDGETGTLLAPPPEPGAFAAALEALLADPERRARMGARGRERWEERFSAERWAQRLRAVYEQALAEAGGRR